MCTCTCKAGYEGSDCDTTSACTASSDSTKDGSDGTGEKGKKHKLVRRVLEFPVRGLDVIARVLRRWRRLLLALNIGNPAAPGSLWRLPGDPIKPFTSNALTAWLTDVCTRHGFAPASGHKWTSHSLRKGSASAAAAAGMPRLMLYQIGGWSENGTTPEKHYIDRNIQCTDSVRFYFSWCWASRGDAY